MTSFKYFCRLFPLLLVPVTMASQIRTSLSLEGYGRVDIDLLGKVKEVKVEVHRKPGGPMESRTYLFDEHGEPLDILEITQGLNAFRMSLEGKKYHYIFKNGKLLSALNVGPEKDGEVFSYDSSGNRIFEKHYMSGILVKEIISGYYVSGRIKSVIEYLYGGFSDYDEKTEKDKDNYRNESKEYSYDDAGNLILVYTKNYRKNFREEEIFRYDSLNNLVEEGRCYIPKEQDTCNYRGLFGYIYNDKNQLIKKFDLAQFSPHNTDQIYVYDEKGNKTESIGYYLYPENEPELGYHFKYEYDEYGNIIKDVEVVGEYRSLGFERYKTEVTKYDEHQNIVLKEYLTENGDPVKIETFEYRYDKKGNWIKSEHREGKNYKDLKVTEVTKRRIKYY